MGRESLRSVRGEKHILEMFKDSSPQGVTAECGVNRAVGARGQIGHFSLDFAVMMHLCCGPARATAASSSKSPPLVARFDLRRGAPHLTPPRAPPPEPSCGRRKRPSQALPALLSPRRSKRATRRRSCLNSLSRPRGRFLGARA